MINLIKSLVRSGFDVKIITIEPSNEIQRVEFDMDSAKEHFVNRLKKREAELKPKKKRIN